ncbi:hypothetical protein H312_01779 [Anncaliia algerae PRA339]|uniref:ISXO2-like transposase domain-containing protein n=1 Tax=Anncaliia algerae PRA339 TaxID=1288291 RepID=A0A059F1H5_9MICR|nr:hypothetical protein H312_01779 [Anncaliia algerae PRA339]
MVEIDKSKFGKVKYHRGYRVDGVWVFGMVKRIKEKRIVTIAVTDISRENLICLLKKNVRQESIVYRDSFLSYSTLKEYF